MAVLSHVAGWPRKTEQLPQYPLVPTAGPGPPLASVRPTTNLRPPTLDPVFRPYDLPRAAVPGFAPVFRRVDLFQAIELAD